VFDYSPLCYVVLCTLNTLRYASVFACVAISIAFGNSGYFEDEY
jgi:hypothetical protein